MIEGQGSLFHVSYSGVTMALIHGGAPDALILSHEPTRRHMRGLPGYGMPSLEALRDLALPVARIANPKAEVVGISINTAALSRTRRCPTSRMSKSAWVCPRSIRSGRAPGGSATALEAL